eukprot:COSAG01_NODE_1794_length_9213_cov_16.947773_7_plen_392_part_01
MADMLNMVFPQFTPERCERALEKYDGDIMKAADYLAKQALLERPTPYKRVERAREAKPTPYDLSCAFVLEKTVAERLAREYWDEHIASDTGPPLARAARGLWHHASPDELSSGVGDGSGRGMSVEREKWTFWKTQEKDLRGSNPVQSRCNTQDTRQWSFLFDVQPMGGGGAGGAAQQRWMRFVFEPIVRQPPAHHLQGSEVEWSVVLADERAQTTTHIEQPVLTEDAAAALAKEWFEHGDVGPLGGDFSDDYVMVLPPVRIHREARSRRNGKQQHWWTIVFETRDKEPPHSRTTYGESQLRLRFGLEHATLEQHDCLQWEVAVIDREAGDFVHRFRGPGVDEKALLRRQLRLAPPPSVLGEAERAQHAALLAGLAHHALHSSQPRTRALLAA